MPLKHKHEIPPGLKNRPGLNGNQRLPSINTLVNRLNGSTSNLKPASLVNSSSNLTRGGVSKRIFKPNIPLKLDRNLKEDNEQEIEQDELQISDQLDANQVISLKSNESNRNLRKQKDLIQIEGTFEGFKAEAKSRPAYSNGFASSSSNHSSNSSATKNCELKNESKDKRLKTDSDAIKREKQAKLDKIRRIRLAKDDYQSDELEDDLSLGDEEMPISWSNYSKLINQLNDINKEDNNVEEKLANGRLILMPCIFGNVQGDTGYKLQVLKSGKMRLVDKKSGFTIDLLNTGDLEHDAIKEVVELEDDKLLRYGSLKNMDIYSPVRNLNSDYSILQD